jgi:hypothetical protein
LVVATPAPTKENHRESDHYEPAEDEGMLGGVRMPGCG